MRTVAPTAEGDISVSLSALCLIRDDEWGDGASGGSHRGAAPHVSGHVRFDTRHTSRVSERKADADALLSERFLKQRPSCSTR